jgi:peptidoglycan/xylan/chitin deacetylase (PgdA/CDA1 family)
VTAVPNYLTVDVETWAFGDTPELRGLGSAERKALDNGYVLESMRKVLALLREYRVKMTMFVVGQQVEWYPELPEMILADGHELGLHSHIHYPIESAEALRKDLAQAMPVIEKYGIKGYRAPLIYLPAGGFEVLAEFGFRFDSSVYGPFTLAGLHQGVVEVPISAVRWRQSPANLYLPRHLSLPIMARERELPFGSSYFAGFFGRRTRHFMRHVNRLGHPAVVFVHNWQIFPPSNVSFPPRGYLLRHPAYWPFTRNLERTFREILEEFPIDKMGTFSERVRATAEG